MGLLVGAEAISTTRFLASQKKQVDWSENAPGSVEDRGPGSDGLSTPYMRKHMLYAAPQAYALLEQARRARLGLEPEEYAEQMGELFAPFIQVAATNPHTMSRDTYSAAELINVTEKEPPDRDPPTPVAWFHVTRSIRAPLCC